MGAFPLIRCNAMAQQSIIVIHPNLRQPLEEMFPLRALCTVRLPESVRIIGQMMRYHENRKRSLQRGERSTV